MSHSRRLLVGAMAVLCRQAAAHSDEVPDLKTAEDVENMDRLTRPLLEKLIAGVDRDKDSKMTVAELLKFGEEMRITAAHEGIDYILKGDGHALGRDFDKDGRLSLDEFMAGDLISGLPEHEQGMEREKFRVADKDGDGFLKGVEVANAFFPESHHGVLEVVAKQTLTRKDANNDGLLTLEEFWFGDVPVEHRYELRDSHKKDFEAVDKDGNGKVDIKELMHFESGSYHINKALQDLLRTADEDKDGHLTVDEIFEARDEIEDMEAHYHLLAWGKHMEL
eukprot:TRINITY_DN20712_c0_g1_i3.p1 TRINITY_DN20712_c0_g1~~TRINITY_DN20712_c0_g1_i3.p1  ORF type:complete len:311 (+),score=71.61 TRINITY_DN20712_c0_g1_i3:97-933(+)